MTGLEDALQDMGIAFNHVTIVELAGLATAMKRILPTSPEFKRGRR